VVSKFKKILPVVLMLVIIFTCIVCGHDINVRAQDGTPVTFPDSNLEAAIRKAINRPEGPIYATNLESITMLTPHSRNISDLTGLEYLVNLTDLDLRDNQISDISLLASLARLTKLNLSFNQISDISSLASLTNLTALDLSWNEISNLSPLVGLTNLRFLSLEQNNVNDISALVENIGLSEGDTVILTNNPLSATSLDQELQELFEAYQPRASKSGIELKLDNRESLPLIETDAARLRRVFANLLDNAIKFTQGKGTVTILTQQTDFEVSVKIIDEGIGIGSRELLSIFEPFQRGKDAEKTDGFGLGLAAVKSIVEAHGGRVLVESELGKGSVFTVILPK